MKYLFILLGLLPSLAFAALYNPNCDYRDISNKCVSVKAANFDIEDKELNLLYKEALSVIQKAEDDNEGYAWMIKPFIKSQKAWLRYRDAFCAFDSEVDVWKFTDDESIGANKDCMADITALRNKQLKSIIKKYRHRDD